MPRRGIRGMPRRGMYSTTAAGALPEQQQQQQQWRCAERSSAFVTDVGLHGAAVML